MADEAILKIQIQGSGSTAESAGGGNAPSAGAAETPRAEPASPPPAGKSGMQSFFQSFGKTLFKNTKIAGMNIGEMIGGEGAAGAEGVGAAAGGAGAAGVAGPIGAALAGVLLKLKEVAQDTAIALKNFALDFVQADTNPSNAVVAIGNFAKETTKSIPVISTFGQAVGDATQTLGSFMSAMDGFVDRFAGYSPQLAGAQVQADITNILNDFKRAQEATPALVEYINARTELQQKFEDAKVRFLEKMEPIIQTGMELVGDVGLPLIEDIFNTVVEIGRYLPFGIGDRVEQLIQHMKELKEKGEYDKFESPTDLIMKGKFPFQTGPEGARLDPWS